jgi:hypothetical protein
MAGRQEGTQILKVWLDNNFTRSRKKAWLEMTLRMPHFTPIITALMPMPQTMCPQQSSSLLVSILHIDNQIIWPHGVLILGLLLHSMSC